MYPKAVALDMSHLTDLAPKPHVVVRTAIEALLAGRAWNVMSRKRMLDQAVWLLRGAGMSGPKARRVRKRIVASAKTLRDRQDRTPHDVDLAVDLALQD